jgi:hypothetical protein
MSFRTKEEEAQKLRSPSFLAKRAFTKGEKLEIEKLAESNPVK